MLRNIESCIAYENLYLKSKEHEMEYGKPLDNFNLKEILSQSMSVLNFAKETKRLSDIKKFYLAFSIFNRYRSLKSVDCSVKVAFRASVYVADSLFSEFTSFEIITGSHNREHILIERVAHEILELFNGNVITSCVGIIENSNKYTLLYYLFPELSQFKPSFVIETFDFLLTGYPPFSPKLQAYVALSNIIMNCIYQINTIDDEIFNMNRNAMASTRKSINSDALRIIDCLVIEGNILETYKIKIIGEGLNMTEDTNYLAGKLSKTVGKGSGGKIKIACIDGIKYAVKIIDMYAVDKQDNMKEIIAMNLMKNDNTVVTIHHFTINDSICTIIMDLGECDLDTLIKRGLDISLVPKYFRDIAASINACHYHDIIHRDIKPQNIVMMSDGTLKLIDFGISIPFASVAENLEPGMACTLWYRAPEAFFGFNYGKGVDIWAAGTVFGEMLNGSPLFNGDSEKTMLMMIGNLVGLKSEDYGKTKRIYYMNENTNKFNKLFGRYSSLIRSCFEPPQRRISSVRMYEITKEL